MADAPVVLRSPASLEELLPIAQARIEAHPDKLDSFKVRLHRVIGGQKQHIATLEGASLEMIANPERWIPPLCGGGPVFVMNVVHASETVPLGSCTVNLPGAPLQKINPGIVNSAGWQGPPTITYPSPSSTTQAEAAAGLAEAYRLLGPSPAQGAGAVRGDTATPPAGGSEHSEIVRRMDMERVAQAIGEVQRRSDERLANLMEKFDARIAALAQAQAKPQKSVAEMVIEAVPLITALGSIVTPILAAGRATAADAAKAQREESAAARARSEQLQADMMKLLSESAAKAGNSQSEVMKIVGPVVESMGVMGKTMLQQVATMRELASGEQQPSEWVEVLKALAGAAAEVMVAKASAPGAPVAPPRQLPPAQSAPAGANGATAPQQPPAAAAETDEAEHAQMQEWLKQATPEQVLVETVKAIQTETDPAALAEAFLDSVSLTPGMAQAIEQAGGAPKLFRARVGDSWLSSHMQYAQALAAALAGAEKRRAAQPQNGATP